MSELYVTNVKLSVSNHDVCLSFRFWPALECTMAPNFTKHQRKILLTIFSRRCFSGGMVLFFPNLCYCELVCSCKYVSREDGVTSFRLFEVEFEIQKYEKNYC